jgi:hypothetical protein
MNGPGPGCIPYYVGKATKQSFEQECFTNHKLLYHYNPVLQERAGSPCLFLVYHEVTKGAIPKSAIDDLEEHLIAYAASRNDDLTNKRRLPRQIWSIAGVLPANVGARSTAAKAFAKLMGI